jgi:hypothetical protein
VCAVEQATLVKFDGQSRASRATVVPVPTSQTWLALHRQRRWGRVEGARWDAVGVVTHTTAAAARAAYAQVVDRQEGILGRDVAALRRTRFS